MKTSPAIAIAGGRFGHQLKLSIIEPLGLPLVRVVDNAAFRAEDAPGKPSG